MRGSIVQGEEMPAMRRARPVILVSVLLLIVFSLPSAWGMDPGIQSLSISRGEEGFAGVEPIADPLEPVNRVFFHFNDKLYFWFLKPVAEGYEMVIPEPLRVSVRNLFSNLTTPIRAANCLLQGDLKGVGTETLRFVLNTTLGVGGFGDPAKEIFEIKKQDEDLGQSIGVYGLGPGFFINWPVFGPSSLRDTVGSVGDAFLDPLTYLPSWYSVAAKGYRRINEASLRLGEYESFKKAALDPYIALRSAYHQYRENKIKE